MDGRDLGRTFPSKLSVVGDIERSLQMLNGLIEQRIAPRAEIYAQARDTARQVFAASRDALEARPRTRRPTGTASAGRRPGAGPSIAGTPIVDS